MHVNEHKPGQVCWNELAAVDAGAAKRFYTGLFGWDARDDAMPDGGAYTMMTKGGAAVCALYQKRAGQLTSWSTYISVQSANKAAGAAEAAGGKVLSPPFDVMDAGRMAILADPTGATFCVWEARRHAGAGVVGEPGSVVWNELATNDAPGARRFYTRVFGWVADVVTVKPAGSSATTYTTFYAPGARVAENGDRKAARAAGCLEMNEAWAGIPPHWSTYFGADDVDAVASRAAALGGRVLSGPFDAPGVGRLALLLDPGGAAFNVIRFAS